MPTPTRYCVRDACLEDRAERKRAKRRAWAKAAYAAKRAEQESHDELGAVAARARRIVEPGRKPCARATYRLARAEGREATRDAALELAAELVAWAARLRPVPGGPQPH